MRFVNCYGWRKHSLSCRLFFKSRATTKNTCAVPILPFSYSNCFNARAKQIFSFSKEGSSDCVVCELFWVVKTLFLLPFLVNRMKARKR